MAFSMQRSAKDMNARRIDRLRRGVAAVLAAWIGLAAWATQRSPARADEPGPQRVARSERLAPGAVRSAVRRATDDTFAEVVLDSELPVLVDFYAVWCGPCRAMTPTLEDFARETPRVRVVKVDVDENPKLAARYGVKSLPSLVVFQDGRPIVKHTGASDKKRLQAMFDLYADAPSR
jgi:thioredoxin